MRQFKVSQTFTDRDSNLVSALFRDINRYSVPKIEEEVALAQRIHNGDKKALEELVCRNLRFVVTVAKQHTGYGLTLNDLFSEGCIGLQTAAERYDETRGFRFATYAVWWIRQAIKKAIVEQASFVRIPSNQVNQLNKIDAIRNSFLLENNREPTDAELAEIAGVTEEKVAEANDMRVAMTSIDAPLGGSDDCSPLVNFVADNGGATDSLLEHESLRHDIDAILATLPPKESTVLTMYFGLAEGGSRSVEEIANYLGLSRERTRQICNSGLQRIRRNRNAMNRLSSYAC